MSELVHELEWLDHDVGRAIAPPSLQQIEPSAATFIGAVRDKDHYGRQLAVCRVTDIDFAAAQAKGGLAVAYRKFTRDYVDEGDYARSAKRGVWSDRFEMPWGKRNRAANARRE